jgi:hypothetical protein
VKLLVDSSPLADLARAVAGHHWTWTRDGLRASAETLGWQIVQDRGQRIDLLTPLGSSAAMLFGEELVAVEWALSEPLEVTENDVCAVDDAETEVFEAWQWAREVVARALGAPAFADGRANPAYPMGEEFADWLACWPLESGYVCIKAVHEDGGLPYRVSLVVEPPSDT